MSILGRLVGSVRRECLNHVIKVAGPLLVEPASVRVFAQPVAKHHIRVGAPG